MQTNVEGAKGEAPGAGSDSGVPFARDIFC